MRDFELLEMSYDDYMKKVDELLVSTTGMNSKCIADYDYYTNYMTGATPNQAVEQALQNEFGNSAPKIRHLRLV
jgi:hypothetical protein